MDIISLKEQVDKGLSTVVIAKYFNISQSTIRYWLKKFQLKTDWQGYLRNKRKFSDQEILETWNKSDSINDFLINLGVGNSGGAWYHYRNRLKSVGVNLDPFNGRLKGRIRGGLKTAEKSRQRALSKKCRLARPTLKKYLESQGILYKCVKCKISEWKGKKLKLHIHHKDGDKTHNTIDNLEYQCPNCHCIEHYSEQ